MKFFSKTLVALALFSSVAITTTSCNKVSYNYDDFYGICALTGEAGGGIDKGLTKTWTARNIKAMGFKSMRFWLTLKSMFEFDENDEMTIIQGYYNVQKGFYDACVSAGIRNFTIMVSGFAYPYGVDYENTYSVPDPEEDPELYKRWLKVNAMACKKLKELFPLFNTFEPGNEPDFDNATCIHKDGFIWDGNYGQNVDYLFSDTAKASIICDLCWYIRKAVREVDPNAKVTIPGLTTLETAPSFLETIYKCIESKKLPIGTEYSDTDPDNYFDVLNWHPYSKKSTLSGPLDDEWVEFNKKMYQVAIDHGDDGKPIIFTELGWTTFNKAGDEEKEASALIGKLLVEGVEKIRKELPMVEAVYYFRLSNTLYQKSPDGSGAEESFGLFYHPELGGGPREAAKVIAKQVMGDPNYVLEDHLEPYNP